MGSISTRNIDCISYQGEEKWEVTGLPFITNELINVIVDKESNILYTGGYREILGISGQKVIGKRLYEIEPEAKTLSVLETGSLLRLVPNVVRSIRNIEVIATIVPLKERNKLVGALAVFSPRSKSGRVVEFTNCFQPEKIKVKRLKLLFCKQVPLLSGRKLVGCSASFRETVRLALKASRTNFDILLTGESGVGKELLAELIHMNSSRRNGKFIRVNCAAIPETLLESELFGYEQGAFTGASAKGRRGKFELANGGTVFLDEVGDMSLQMQAKILRVIQEREFERVGGEKPVKVDIRIIAATNRDLGKMVKQGSFREDLYYRLNVVPIHIPPLREREEDIQLLINYFINQIYNEFGINISLTSDLLAILQNYTWPGNVRELENLLKYAAVLSLDKDSINANLLLAKMNKSQQEKPEDVEDEDVVYIRPGIPLDILLNKVEKKAIETTLKACKYNRTKASDMLGISRRGLYTKAKHHGISI